MKYTFFSALLSVGILIGCPHVQATKRVPASVNDVGVIGPAGEVILYYKKGDHIMVRACDPNTVLGMTPALARTNCQGKTNKVRVESFKNALRNLVSTARLNVLKPLTAKEVEAYLEDGPDSDQIEAMVIELEKINAFISTYGAENADLVRREELVKALRSQETRISAIKKIDAEIEKAVDLIANQATLALTKINSDRNQFLYTVLKQFNPNKKSPCGLKGSVPERINDCSYQPTSEKEGFVLVTRSKDFKEVYKEFSTGLLWSDRLPDPMDYFSAKYACRSNSEEMAGIFDVNWRLPSKEEYEQAGKNGISRALPNMNYSFWSSSEVLYADDYMWLFNVNWLSNRGDGTFFGKREDYNSVRCVARYAW